MNIYVQEICYRLRITLYLRRLMSVEYWFTSIRVNSLERGVISVYKVAYDVALDDFYLVNDDALDDFY